MEPSRILIPFSKKKLRCEMDVLKFSGFLFFCFLVSVCVHVSREFLLWKGNIIPKADDYLFQWLLGKTQLYFYIH